MLIKRCKIIIFLLLTLEVVFIMLINFEFPAIVGHFNIYKRVTFHFMFSENEYESSFITSRTGLLEIPDDCNNIFT